MKNQTPLTRSIDPVRNSRNGSSGSCRMRTFHLIAIGLAWFALSPQARAVCQRGCDPINFNTFLGDDALLNNTTGRFNTANGFQALYYNTTGINNTANGFDALYSNTTGFSNTAIGNVALFYNTTGSNNIALGFSAGVNRTTGSNNIDIGSAGVGGESNTIRVGAAGTQTNTYIAGIYGATPSHGLAVFIDSTGHLGTPTSSARFKDAIQPMDKASEAILKLKPVTFRYKKEIDPAGTSQLGLVAEDVEKVNPDLVVRDKEGKPYTVRYDAVNAMLLNEFLKEHPMMQELKSEVAALTATVKDQAAQIQKVSARPDMQQPALQTVAKNGIE